MSNDPTSNEFGNDATTSSSSEQDKALLDQIARELKFI